MQHLTRKIFGQLGGVNFVAQHWMAKMVKMHAYLVCATAM
jgi:hypothetical protein